MTTTIPLNKDKIKALNDFSIATKYPMVITTCPIIRNTRENNRKALTVSIKFTLFISRNAFVIGRANISTIPNKNTEQIHTMIRAYL